VRARDVYEKTSERIIRKRGENDMTESELDMLDGLMERVQRAKARLDEYEATGKVSTAAEPGSEARSRAINEEARKARAEKARAYVFEPANGSPRASRKKREANMENLRKELLRSVVAPRPASPKKADEPIFLKANSPQLRKMDVIDFYNMSAPAFEEFFEKLTPKDMRHVVRVLNKTQFFNDTDKRYRTIEEMREIFRKKRGDFIAIIRGMTQEEKGAYDVLVRHLIHATHMLEKREEARAKRPNGSTRRRLVNLAREGAENASAGVGSPTRKRKRNTIGGGRL